MTAAPSAGAARVQPEDIVTDYIGVLMTSPVSIAQDGFQMLAASSSGMNSKGCLVCSLAAAS